MGDHFCTVDFSSQKALVSVPKHRQLEVKVCAKVTTKFGDCLVFLCGTCCLFYVGAHLMVICGSYILT